MERRKQGKYKQDKYYMTLELNIKQVFLSTFVGYLEWDRFAQIQAQELILVRYTKWMRSEFKWEWKSLDKIQVIVWEMETDLKEYEDEEEYAICQLLKDTIESINYESNNS